MRLQLCELLIIVKGLNRDDSCLRSFFGFVTCDHHDFVRMDAGLGLRWQPCEKVSYCVEKLRRFLVCVQVTHTKYDSSFAVLIQWTRGMKANGHVSHMPTKLAWKPAKDFLVVFSDRPQVCN